MPQQTRAHSLEARRAERRRRERRRKKRIRALLLLICFIAVIVLIIMAFTSCSHNDELNNNENTEVIASPDVSLAPNESAAPMVVSNKIPSASEENDLLKIIEKADSNGGVKTCYLTFDDGPSETVTASILDTLRRYNVKATFFQVGSIIEANPDMARRVYEEGHLIANHSQSHNYDKFYATENSFITEVKYTEDVILKVTAQNPFMKLFRFPGGSYNAGDHAYEKQIYKETLKDNGYYYIDWNALNGDAEGRTKNAQELLEYVKDYVDTDYSAVVLMHDASAKKATAQALPSIIEYFISEGYVFKRLDEVDYPAPSTPSPTSDTDDTSSDYSYSDDSDSGTTSGSIMNNPSSGTTTRTSVDGTSVTEKAKSY